MKKMPYLIIFLVVLVLIIFAGCKNFMKFSDKIGEENTVDAEVAAEASQLAEEIASQMMAVTDESGVTVYSPEQISEYVSQELTPQAPAATPGVTSGAPASTQKSGSQSAAANQGGSAGQSSAAANNTTKAANNQTPANSTTKAANGQTPATQAQQQQQQQQPSGANEYDILRSGNFYAVGSMKDNQGTQPLEIAITPNSIYMLTKMEGVDMGMLQQNGTLYMLYPAKQIYMEMSSVIMGMMGVDSDELLDISSLGFSDMPDLSGADTVADGEFNGSACKIYSFNKESGSRIVVYMNGNKLLGFEDVSSSGTATTTITSITSTVPADKSAPPANYKKVNMVSFMTEMKDVIG